MDLSNQIILITGASSGIGKLTAQQLARLGATILLAARSVDALNQLVTDINGQGGQAKAYPIDLTKKEMIDRLRNQIIDEWGKVDILINNAGYGVFDRFAHSRIEDIEGMMEVNYLGTVRLIKAFLPMMLERNTGHIINVASIAGKLGSQSFSGYNASKFAVVGFSESLYLELLETGIHVTTICPGPVDTPFFKEGEAQRVLGKRGAKFLMPPEKVVSVILKAIEKKPREIIIPSYMKSILLLKQLFPELFAKLAVRFFPK